MQKKEAPDRLVMTAPLGGGLAFSLYNIRRTTVGMVLVYSKHWEVLSTYFPPSLVEWWPRRGNWTSLRPDMKEEVERPLFTGATVAIKTLLRTYY